MTDLHPLVADPPHARIWRRSARRARAFRPAVHAELVVLHGLSGRGRYVVDGAVVPLQAGTLLLAWAGRAHFLASDSADFDMWVGLVSDRFTRGRCDLPPVDGGGLRAEARALAPARSAALAQAAEDVLAAPSPAAGAIGLHWWLIGVWAAWQTAPDAAGQALHPAVARAAQALREDPSLSATALARRVGLSAGRLGQLFRAQMGQSLPAFRTAERLRRVEALVAEHRMALLPAALEAGFGSYAQFWRAWHTAHGCAPREGLRRGP